MTTNIGNYVNFEPVTITGDDTFTTYNFYHWTDSSSQKIYLALTSSSSNPVSTSSLWRLRNWFNCKSKPLLLLIMFMGLV